MLAKRSEVTRRDSSECHYMLSPYRGGYLVKVEVRGVSRLGDRIEDRGEGDIAASGEIIQFAELVTGACDGEGIQRRLRIAMIQMDSGKVKLVDQREMSMQTKAMAHVVGDILDQILHLAKRGVGLADMHIVYTRCK